MPSVYRPQIGGSIEILSDKVKLLLQDDSSSSDSGNSSNYIDMHEKFIEDYMNQNKSKRIKSSSSISDTVEEENHQTQEDFQEISSSVADNEKFSRRPSAKKLFEVNVWNEQQKQLKEKKSQKNTTNISESQHYDEIKATTRELNNDYENLMYPIDFNNYRKREFIYRNYTCNVREPLLLAKYKQMQRLAKNSDRQKFKIKQYNQFLEFTNRRHYIARDDYDKNEYDALAKFNDGAYRTPWLSDRTLVHYHKHLSESRTSSSLSRLDPTQTVSEQTFNLAAPVHDRTTRSALSWMSINHSNVNSRVRLLSSAKCQYIEQQSQRPINFDGSITSDLYNIHKSYRHQSSSVAVKLDSTPTNCLSDDKISENKENILA